jgi:hypothetical protein
VLFFIFGSSPLPAFAKGVQRNYLRGNRYEPDRPAPSSPLLRTAPSHTVLHSPPKPRRKCVSHGLARCMGPKEEDPRFANRYVKDRERFIPSVHPLLRARGYRGY